MSDKQSRVSRPVLREREGAIPYRYSPELHARFGGEELEREGAATAADDGSPRETEGPEAGVAYEQLLRNRASGDGVLGSNGRVEAHHHLAGRPRPAQASDQLVEEAPRTPGGVGRALAQRAWSTSPVPALVARVGW